MNISPIRYSHLWSAIRATPFVFFFHAIAMATTYPNPRNLLYLGAYCINFVVNGFMKIGMKAIYESLGVKTLPILGKGIRPDGATNCTTFLSGSNVPAISYGMPSGHSQNAWFFATFMILELWRQYKQSQNDNRSTFVNIVFNKYPAVPTILAVGLAVFATVVSYSRVWIENCHTIQQVIFGGLFGIVCGFAAHYAITSILQM